MLNSRILVAEMPLAPVAKCMAGASVLADIVIGKFMYHLPFYRLIQQYKESGIVISDSTMGGWYEQTVDKLKPHMIGCGKRYSQVNTSR